MIGMVNANGENDVYFSAPTDRRCSVNMQRQHSQVNYTEDGRVILDGTLQSRCADGLWQQLITRALIDQAAKLEQAGKNREEVNAALKQLENEIIEAKTNGNFTIQKHMQFKLDNFNACIEIDDGDVETIGKTHL